MKVKELKEFLSHNSDEMEVRLLVNTALAGKSEKEIKCIHVVLHPLETNIKNYILIGD